METPSPNATSPRTKLIWILLAVLGTTTYLAGYLFPPAIKTQTQLVKECPKQIYETLGYSCENFNSHSGSIFALELTDLQPKNQFVSLEGLLFLSDKANSNKLKLDVEVTSYAVLEDYEIVRAYENKDRKTITFDCEEPSGQGSRCFPYSFANILNVQDRHYLFIVKFMNSDSATTNKIQQFGLVFATRDEDYADDLMFFKVVMFIFALIGWGVYKAFVGKISLDLTSSEQRCVGYLSFALVLLNQPFIDYGPSEQNFYGSLFGIIAVSLQSALLVLFWFIVVEKLASNDSTYQGKTLIKTVALIHFVVSVLGYTVLAQDQQTNPQVDIRTSQNPLVGGFRLYLSVFTAITAAWTIIRFFRICRKYKDFDWRDRTSFTFSFSYALCHIFFAATGSLQVTSYHGTRVVLILGINTLYTLLLQVIHAPFEDEVEESDKRRKYETPHTPHTPETPEQYGELDMSDASSPNLRNDKVELRKNDGNRRNQNHSEDYEV